MMRRPLWAGSVIVLAMLGSVPVADAFIPMVDRTMQAIARVNRTSGRTQALQLELTMRIGERTAVAQGELISHPTGMARLELRGNSGRVERYLLSGDELSATRNGEPLSDPQPLLQPLFLLQPASEATLRAGLASFGVLVDSMGLAPCGEDDCFVIGDPRIAAPLPSAPVPENEAFEVLEDPLAAGEDLVFETSVDPQGIALDDAEVGDADDAPIPEDALLPRLWVGTQDLQVRRIDRSNGVFTIVGPMAAFEKLQIPAWFEIHEPGKDVVRFEVDRAVAVNAPPKAFSRAWLMAPMPKPTAPAAAGALDAPASPGVAPGPSTTPGQRSAPAPTGAAAPAAPRR